VPNEAPSQRDTATDRDTGRIESDPPLGEKHLFDRAARGSGAALQAFDYGGPSVKI
jgi:hypothetical protein